MWGMQKSGEELARGLELNRLELLHCVLVERLVERAAMQPPLVAIIH